MAAAGLAGVASPIVTTPDASEVALREHDAITRRIHEAAASLPARFGQVFANEGEIARALRERADVLTPGLERVADRVEIAVTLRWRATRGALPPVAGDSGRAYLERRAAVEQLDREARAVVARLVAELPYEQALIRHKTCPRQGVAAIVAILIDRDDVTAARARVIAFGERSAEVSAVVDGVFAPYSFAS